MHLDETQTRSTEHPEEMMFSQELVHLKPECNNHSLKLRKNWMGGRNPGILSYWKAFNYKLVKRILSNTLNHNAFKNRFNSVHTKKVISLHCVLTRSQEVITSVLFNTWPIGSSMFASVRMELARLDICSYTLSIDIHQEKTGIETL